MPCSVSSPAIAGLDLLTGFIQEAPLPPLPGDTFSSPMGRGSSFSEGLLGDEELFFYASFKNPEAFRSSESLFFSSAVRGAKGERGGPP